MYDQLHKRGKGGFVQVASHKADGFYSYWSSTKYAEGSYYRCDFMSGRVSQWGGNNSEGSAVRAVRDL